MTARKLALAATVLAAFVLIAAPMAANADTPDGWDDAVAALDCPEYTVPGWIGDDGFPTSCVGDAPCPEVLKGEPCPADVVEPVADVPAVAPTVEPVIEPEPEVVAPEPVAVVETEPELLAETGFGTPLWLFVAAPVLVAAGVILRKKATA